MLHPDLFSEILASNSRSALAMPIYHVDPELTQFEPGIWILGVEQDPPQVQSG